MMNPVNNQFKQQARQMQEELMNGVDKTLNNVASKINVKIFQISKQLKLDLIQKIDYGILTTRTSPASQEELKKIQLSTNTKLEKISKRFRKAFQKVFEDRSSNDQDEDSAQQPQPNKKRMLNTSFSNEPSYQKPQLKIVEAPRTVIAVRKSVQSKLIKDMSTEVFQCPLCPKEFYRMVSIVKHMIENHQICKEGTYQCSYCQLVDKSSDYITQHLLEKHHDPMIKELTGDEFRNVEDLAEKLKQVKNEEIQTQKSSKNLEVGDVVQDITESEET